MDKVFASIGYNLRRAADARICLDPIDLSSLPPMASPHSVIHFVADG